MLTKNRRARWISIGFRHPVNWLKTIATAFVLAFAIEISFEVFFNGLIERITGSPIDLSDFETIRGNLTVYLTWLLIGWVVGGFLEEMLFRGFFITRIALLFSNERSGNLAGLGLSSLIFGFSHLYQGWSGVISTGLIAVLLGTIFIRNKKNIWVNVFTHGFINFIGLTVLYLDVDKYLSSLVSG